MRRTWSFSAVLALALLVALFDATAMTAQEDHTHDACQDQLKKLEEREFPYKGVHQRSNEYQRGMFVTFEGSMWYCCADTTRQLPGADSDWQLAVKGSE